MANTRTATPDDLRELREMHRRLLRGHFDHTLAELDKVIQLLPEGDLQEQAKQLRFQVNSSIEPAMALFNLFPIAEV